MEQYIRCYFRDGVKEMKRMLLSKGFTKEPVIYLEMDNCDELKDAISLFFKKEEKVYLFFLILIKNSY